MVNSFKKIVSPPLVLAYAALQGVFVGAFSKVIESVFGTGEEATVRKAAGDPLLTKPITSELGGVSPTIVVPGRWSKRDLAYQAEHVVTQKLHKYDLDRSRFKDSSHLDSVEA